MLIRATILTQIILLVAKTVAQVPSDTPIATDNQTPAIATTDDFSAPVVAPAGIYGADATMKQQILDAMDRFADAGLELPEVRIYVHDSEEPCNGNGNMGLYNKGGDQQRIDLCHRSPKVLTHELAHVWEYHNLDDTTRQAFVDRAGLRTWNDKTVPHPARGVEQVAWIIVCGLDDQPIQQQLVNHNSEKLDHYELLTGTPAPRIAHLNAPPEDSTPAPVITAVDVAYVGAAAQS